MSKPLKTTLLTLASGLCYALLFYFAEPGLSIFLFDALVVGVVIWCRPELNDRLSFWLGAGTLFVATALITVVQSNVGMFAHHFAFLLMMSFALGRELRFLVFGLLLGLLKSLPRNIWR